MNNLVSVLTVERINHLKVVALALLASFVIMLIGITAQATDDIDGYGVAQIGQRATITNAR
jgi:transposase